MTHAEIDAMPAGRGMDALVAENVMGKVRCEAEGHYDGSAPWPCHAQPDSPDQGAETPAYSTDIAAAWSVLERLISLTHCPVYIGGRSEGPFSCWVDEGDDTPRLCAGGETASLAICRTALKASMAEGA